MLQYHSDLNAMDCIYESNKALDSGGAIYLKVRIVSQSNFIEILVYNNCMEYLYTFMGIKKDMDNVFLLCDEVLSGE